MEFNAITPIQGVGPVAIRRDLIILALFSN